MPDIVYVRYFAINLSGEFIISRTKKGLCDAMGIHVNSFKLGIVKDYLVKEISLDEKTKLFE